LDPVGKILRPKPAANCLVPAYEFRIVRRCFDELHRVRVEIVEVREPSTQLVAWPIGSHAGPYVQAERARIARTQCAAKSPINRQDVVEKSPAHALRLACRIDEQIGQERDWSSDDD
jgi:hypothetical protein